MLLLRLAGSVLDPEKLLLPLPVGEEEREGEWEEEGERLGLREVEEEREGRGDWVPLKLRRGELEKTGLPVETIVEVRVGLREVEGFNVLLPVMH